MDQVSAEDARKTEALQATVSSATKELEKLHKSASGLHEKVAKLQREIDEAGGEALKKKKDEVTRTLAVSPQPIYANLEGLPAKKRERNASRKTKSSNACQKLSQYEIMLASRAAFWHAEYLQCNFGSSAVSFILLHLAYLRL